MTTYIYSLEDPVTHEIRYVGKANNLKGRFKAHCNKAHNKSSHKRNWVNSILARGLKPIILMIEEVPTEEWRYWEKFWILQFKQWGFNLVNHANGGEGTDFGNQTSFKKGNVSWNNGTAKYEYRKCQNCGTLFNILSYRKTKCCSKECAAKLRIKNGSPVFKKGNKSWNIGLKYRNKGNKPVLQYTLNGEFIKKWNGASDAAEFYKCGRSNIQNCCNGKSKSARNYLWEYE